MELQNVIPDFLTSAVVILAIGSVVYPMGLASLRTVEDWLAQRHTHGRRQLWREFKQRWMTRTNERKAITARGETHRGAKRKNGSTPILIHTSEIPAANHGGMIVIEAKPPVAIDRR